MRDRGPRACIGRLCGEDTAMDGDNFGDGRHQECRRHLPAGQSPMDILRQLPALVVLERMPVPVLAVGDDGTILFANAAFSQTKRSCR